ncbi:MAG: hypothetical protein Q8O37_17490 [Sulfuricellaceae bacterium]|nr:hypothetical protein [Sulfuricellaceae bacterium]
MSLANLIRKRDTGNLATAIPAIPATRRGTSGGAVARIATIAVANPITRETDPAPDTRHFRWLIHFPDRDPVETTCLPEPTHAEVMAMYPDAIAAEPLPERYAVTVTPKVTPEQETELRALVAAVGVADGFTHAEQQEALDLALGDPDAALVSYRAMAIEQGIILDRDDRRRCDQCANLSPGGKCAAWQAVGAMRGYSPVRDIPRRCEGYAPGPDDPDKRGGLERWPWIGMKGALTVTQ